MGEKKIEPTEAMVRDVESWSGIIGVDDVALLRYALNHPDAAGLFADSDDRPWEPLNGRRVYVGDEVRQEAFGFAVTAVVARVDGRGDPMTAEGAIIGDLRHGTWYVRRAVQALPTKPGAVIVPADGHKHITATVGGKTYHAREAIFSCSVLWLGVWRSTDSTAVSALPEDITPGTWKVDDQ